MGEKMQTKTCTRCGKTKEISEYYKEVNGKYGVFSRCKVCIKEISIQYNRDVRRHNTEKQIWHDMRQRCENPNGPAYKYYGGKGIDVCLRWYDFDKFLEDMGKRPTPKHQIDRIDSDKNYEPSNCRWVTPTANIRNRKGFIDMDIARSIRSDVSAGMTVIEAAKSNGTSYGVTYHVANNLTWREDMV